MRTKAQVHCLSGHTNTVAAVISQAVDPQIVTGSHDSTIRLWDLASGRSIVTLTHHKVNFHLLRNLLLLSNALLFDFFTFFHIILPLSSYQSII